MYPNTVKPALIWENIDGNPYTKMVRLLNLEIQIIGHIRLHDADIMKVIRIRSCPLKSS